MKPPAQTFAAPSETKQVPDFYQHRLVTTLHQLADPSFDEQQEQLKQYTRDKPITLVMPALYSEVEGPALPGILDHLEKVEFINSRLTDHRFTRQILDQTIAEKGEDWEDLVQLIYGDIYDEAEELRVLADNLPVEGTEASDALVGELYGS